MSVQHIGTAWTNPILTPALLPFPALVTTRAPSRTAATAFLPPQQAFPSDGMNALASTSPALSLKNAACEAPCCTTHHRRSAGPSPTARLAIARNARCVRHSTWLVHRRRRRTKVGVGALRMRAWRYRRPAGITDLRLASSLCPLSSETRARQLAVSEREGLHSREIQVASRSSGVSFGGVARAPRLEP